MITFQRQGNKVQIIAETGLSSQANVLFEVTCSTDMYAELLYKQFRDKLWARIESVREREYNEGYKAGRSKTVKRKYFYSSLEDKSY